MSSKPNSRRLACTFAICCALTLFLAFTTEAKTNAVTSRVVAQSKELILQIEGLNTKNYAAVRKAIEDNPGVTFRDYCFSNNTIMYVIDRDIQMDNQFLDDALAPHNLRYQIKEGTISQVQANCTDTQNENPTE